jgi:hypothetical protein
MPPSKDYMSYEIEHFESDEGRAQYYFKIMSFENNWSSFAIGVAHVFY